MRVVYRHVSQLRFGHFMSRSWPRSLRLTLTRRGTEAEDQAGLEVGRSAPGYTFHVPQSGCHCRRWQLSSGSIFSLFGQGVRDIGSARAFKWRNLPVSHSSLTCIHGPCAGLSWRPTPPGRSHVVARFGHPACQIRRTVLGEPRSIRGRFITYEMWWNIYSTWTGLIGQHDTVSTT